jgi:hypothetical protein
MSRYHLFLRTCLSRNVSAVPPAFAISDLRRISFSEGRFCTFFPEDCSCAELQAKGSALYFWAVANTMAPLMSSKSFRVLSFPFIPFLQCTQQPICCSERDDPGKRTLFYVHTTCLFHFLFYDLELDSFSIFARRLKEPLQSLIFYFVQLSPRSGKGIENRLPFCWSDLYYTTKPPSLALKAALEPALEALDLHISPSCYFLQRRRVMSDFGRRDTSSSGEAAGNHDDRAWPRWVAQVPDTNPSASASSASVPGAFHASVNAELLRGVSSLSSGPVHGHGVMHADVNSELMRLLHSSRHQAPTAASAALQTSDFADSSLGGQILANLSVRSMRDNFQPPKSALSLFAISQLQGNDGANNCLQRASQELSREEQSAQRASQLSREEQRVVSLMRDRRTIFPGAVGSIPERMPTRMPGIEDHLASLLQDQRTQLALADATSMMQEQRAQRVLAAATSMNAASHYPPTQKAEPPHYLEHLQQLVQLQRDRAIFSDSFLQAQPQGQPGPPPLSLPFASLAQRQSLTALPPNSGLPTTVPIPIPLPYGRYGKAESFPGKLYRMLAEVESQGNTHIISFTPDGKAFRIHDQDAFLEEVAPKYFRQSLFNSFVRQLNFYGFERLSHGPDRGAFAHASFLRGHPELVRNMERQVLAPRAKKAVPSPATSV